MPPRHCHAYARDADAIDALAKLAGGSDSAARFLSFYCPPKYLSGCSQAIWQGDEPLMVRNYDYSAKAFDAVVLHPDRQDRFTDAFLRPPLYSTAFGAGFGTLYTAAYRPRAGRMELLWPGLRWPFTPDGSEEGARHILVPET